MHRVGFQVAAMMAVLYVVPSIVLGQTGEDVCENHNYGKKKCLSLGCCQWDDGECWSRVGNGPCDGGDDGDDDGGDDGGGGGGETGEDVCEGHNYGKTKCLSLGCCEWEDSGCWSRVGRRPCDGGDDGGGGGGKGPLLPDLEGWVDGKVKWHTPPSGWGSCGSVTTVFGVPICVSKKGWAKVANRAKANHVAHVFYQLLDNDADGVPDDSDFLNYMVNKGYLLWVPDSESDSKKDGNWPSGVGVTQMTGLFEAVLGTCQSPANRGADPKDRSTWAAAVETTKGCSTKRDATTEEIHHLMTVAAGKLWPDLWGRSFQSEVGKAIQAANGNCGWGYTNNWKDPSTNKCQGQYAYNDKTCDEECLVVEGIYWASVSYIGGLYTKAHM